MRHLQALGLAILLGGICGCATQTTHEDLAKRIIATQGNSFPSVLYYVGSSDEYDFFVESNYIFEDTKYRVSLGVIPLRHRLPVQSDRRKW